MSEEQRKAPRYAIWFPMRMETHGDVILGISRDVSEGGVAMVVAAEPKDGASVKVTLKLPGDEERVVEGTILRVSKNDADTEGLWRYKVAVAFDEPVPELAPLLVEIERTSQIPPEP